MFDTVSFGSYLSRLRKSADMTQSELGERINVTRQAVSKYELGDSFPDISILVKIAEIFEVGVEDLISSGNPTSGEAIILGGVAAGRGDVVARNINDLVSLAPLLKPSVLRTLSEGLLGQGIDITNIVELARYLSDTNVLDLLEKASFENVDAVLLEKLIPLLDEQSKQNIFERILDGEMDWHMIRTLIPHMKYMEPQIEAAVIEGVLPYEVIGMLHEELWFKSSE